MPKITFIEGQKPILPPRKKVAAYARVSKDTEQLMHSLSTQVSYYSDLIQRTPGWEYAGVYVDAGITGTSAAARPQFQQSVHRQIWNQIMSKDFKRLVNDQFFCG